MSSTKKDRTTKPESEQDGDYAVGYKKPPLHSRFKKGTSGNPQGRQKNHKPRDMLKSVQQTFLRETQIREGDQTRGEPKIIALMEKTLSDALRGDARASALALKLAEKFGVFAIKDRTTLDLSQLTPDERTRVGEAFELLRKARTVIPEK